MLKSGPHCFTLAGHRTGEDEGRGDSCLMILNVGLFLLPAETLVCVSPGGDNGTQVVDGLPQSICLHHQIQLVILLWLIWQADTS